ncbi:Pleckstrin homology domain-containing protein [Fomes fomentarius]|nr:Pleckstrin homology domain-containing protein [Fomes fomentarius]
MLTNSFSVGAISTSIDHVRLVEAKDLNHGAETPALGAPPALEDNVPTSALVLARAGSTGTPSPHGMVRADPISSSPTWVGSVTPMSDDYHQGSREANEEDCLPSGLGVATSSPATDPRSEAQREKNIVENLERRIRDWKGDHTPNFGALCLHGIFKVTKKEAEQIYRVFLFERILLFCNDPPQNGGTKMGEMAIKGRIHLASITHTGREYSIAQHSICVHWCDNSADQSFTLHFRDHKQFGLWRSHLRRLIKATRYRSRPYGRRNDYLFVGFTGSDAMKYQAPLQIHHREKTFSVLVPRSIEYDELVTMLEKEIRTHEPQQPRRPLHVRYKNRDGDLVELSTTDAIRRKLASLLPDEPQVIYVSTEQVHPSGTSPATAFCETPLETIASEAVMGYVGGKGVFLHG